MRSRTSRCWPTPPTRRRSSRAVGSPKRGVGTSTANRVIALARDTHQGDLIAASAHATVIETIRPPAVRDRLVRFGEGLGRARQRAPRTAARSVTSSSRR